MTASGNSSTIRPAGGSATAARNVTPGAASLTIQTAEGIEFALPLAGPVSRLLALTIDLAIVMAITSLASKIISAFAIFGEDTTGAFMIIAYFVINIGYGIAAEWAWRGQTIGKRLLKLRVIDARGLRLQPSQVIMRNLLRPVDGLPAFYLLGGGISLFHPNYQRLGDIAAGTVVVRTPEIGEPDLDQILGGKFNSLLEHRHLAARLRQRVPPAMAALALESLVRRESLEPSARLAVYRELTAYFRSLVEFPAEAVENLPDEQYVRNVVEILFRANRRSPA